MNNEHLMHVYRWLPISFTHGEGVYLYDEKGNRYLDALSGIAVTGLGHAHPEVTKAIQNQAAKLIHTSNLYYIENQILLANTLCRLTKLDQAFFCNSGAEAVETALKLLRLYGHEKGIENPKLIVMKHAFHGRTIATISAGGSQKARQGFEPLLPGFIHVPYNNIQAIEQLTTDPDIVGILVEPIQGEGGIIVPEHHYLNNLRKICDQQNWLLALDEIQTGMGRTGSLFNYQEKGILPDILTMAKGLANGVPIGACLAKATISRLFKPGNHGSTFGGNPLACAAAMATLKVIETQKLWENAKIMGDFLQTELKQRLKNNPSVIEVRGQGLMIGIELDKPCRDILSLALSKKLLFNVTNEKVIRLLPPLIINKEQVSDIIHLLPEIINEWCKTTTA